MSTHRRSTSRRRSLTTLLGAVVLLGLTLSTPAYAAKPDAPRNQAAQSGTGNGHASTSSTAKTDKSTPGKSSSGKSTSGSSSRGKASSHATTGTSGTSGEVHSPQPKSTADRNGTGANQSGPYDSTRDGSPSGNGNGKGAATGKPCAGCVGKADNKNPKGQEPGGSDRNAGYECDRNHGIGRSNPAHTGCRSTDSSSTPGTLVPAPSPAPAPSPTICQDDLLTPADECLDVPVVPGSVPTSGPGSAAEVCRDLALMTGVECSPTALPTIAQGVRDVPGVQAAPSVSGSVAQTTTATGATSSVTSAPSAARAVQSGTEVSTASSGSVSGVLPQTGVSAALLWTAAGGLLLMLGGIVLTGRARIRS